MSGFVEGLVMGMFNFLTVVLTIDYPVAELVEIPVPEPVEGKDIF